MKSPLSLLTRAPLKALLLWKVIVICGGNLAGCAIPPSKDALLKQLPDKYVRSEELLVANLSNDALVEFSSGNFDKAEAYTLQALKLSQDIIANNEDTTSTSSNRLVPLSRNLGAILLRKGLAKEAYDLYLDLLKQDPASPTLNFSKANALVLANKFDEALILYTTLVTESLKKDDSAKTSLLAKTIAGTLYEVGREDEAMEYSCLALELAHSPEEATRHIRLLLLINKPLEALTTLDKYFPSPYLDKDSEVLKLVVVTLGSNNLVERLTSLRSELLSKPSGADEPLISALDNVKTFLTQPLNPDLAFTQVKILGPFPLIDLMTQFQEGNRL